MLYFRCLFAFFFPVFTVSAQQGSYQLEPKSAHLVIKGTVKSGSLNDTLLLFIKEHHFNDTLGNRKIISTTQKITVVREGSFRFTVKDFPVNAYVSLQLRSLGRDIALLKDVLVEQGDELSLHAGDGSVSIFGIGAEKTRCLALQKEAAATAKKIFSQKYPKFSFLSSNDRKIKQFIELYDQQETAELKVLSDFQRLLSPAAFDIMVADVVGFYGHLKYQMFSVLFPYYLPHPEDPATHYLLQLYKVTMAGRTVRVSPDPELGRSKNYAEFVYEWIKCRESYAAALNPKKADVNLFGAITADLKGLLREKTLVLYLKNQLSSYKNSAAMDSMLQFSYDLVKTKYFKEVIGNWKSSFIRGTPMPDFEFEDAKGKIVRLSDLKGKVIFIDMWFSGCGACVYVAKAMPKVEAAFKNKEVVFLSLSADGDKELWLKSIDPHKPVKEGTPYSYSHYTTPETYYWYTGSKSFDHPFLAQFNSGNGYPRLLLIDREFKIYSATPPRPQVEDGQALISLIQEALSKGKKG